MREDAHSRRDGEDASVLLRLRHDNIIHTIIEVTPILALPRRLMMPVDPLFRCRFIYAMPAMPLYCRYCLFTLTLKMADYYAKTARHNIRAAMSIDI